MFALTSHGAQVDYTVMHGKGPYTFRIHDQNCHAIGTLILYDKYKPKYAQLYIYGTYNEIENRYESLARKKEQAEIEKQTDKAIIACLKESFDESHKYVKVFRRARIWHEANKERKYTLKLIEPRKRGATRSYRPEGGEVAALMVGNESEKTEVRDIIVYHKKKGLQLISELHPSYMLL